MTNDLMPTPLSYDCDEETEFRAVESGKWVRRKAAQALIDGLRSEVERLTKERDDAREYGSGVDDQLRKANEAVAALQQSMGAYDPARVERVMALSDAYAKAAEEYQFDPTGRAEEDRAIARAALRAEVAGGAE